MEVLSSPWALMHRRGVTRESMLRPTSVQKRAALLQRETAKHPTGRSDYQMKTMMLCWLRYGIAAAIALGGLAGCGSDSNNNSNNNGASAAPVQLITLSNRADMLSG